MNINKLNAILFVIALSVLNLNIAMEKGTRQTLLDLPPEVQENVLEQHMISIIKNNRNLTPFQLIGHIARELSSFKSTNKFLYQLVENYINTNRFKNILRSELISNDIDINQVDEEGDTALSLAIEQGKSDMVKLLIAAGANVNIQNIDLYYFPDLIRALINGRKDIAKLLIESGADVNTTYGAGLRIFSSRKLLKHEELWHNSALTTAIEMGYQDIVDLLISKGAKISDMALIIAAKLGYIDILKSLINAGVNININVQDFSRETALIWAALKGYKDIVEFLIEHKADVNIQDDAGNTALIYAVHRRRIDIIEFLIEHKADVNLFNEDGETALSLAREKGYEDIATLLKNHGALEDIEGV